MRTGHENGKNLGAHTQRLGRVTASDGTVVGYRQFGRGPGLILLHGGMMASQNFVQLGIALADEFTVIIPDRRGRGMSGTYGSEYTITSDCEDVRALVEHTQASNLFGLSSGAVIALRAALAIPSIRKVAAYEPPFATAGFDPAHWAPRYDREIRAGKLGAAMLTVMKGTGDSKFLKCVPRALLVPLLGLALRLETKRVVAGDVAIAKLVPTMHYDAQIVRDSSAWLPELSALRAELLLIGGSESAVFLRTALDALSEMLPSAERLQLDRAGHLAADNTGRPDLVASSLRRFFRERPAAMGGSNTRG
ncbi:MAG TPA: alpha/beta hydrolase [Polyangiales bacterium]|nr:alpha/beta hydrolase [Polyangiales bacterium]